MAAQFAIGIDLGTTNSVLAYAPLGDESAPGEPPVIELLAVPQLVAASTVEARSSLPSFLYLASDEEGRQGALKLPWSADGDVTQPHVVGEWARRQGAEVPMRTVAAAKSWLAYSKVDRRQAILPWNAPDDIPKISPVTASQRYLEHLVAAWQALHPSAPIAEQQVVLTVPASFDVAARELTHEAALAAGLPESLVLLEEPQAAVYAWLSAAGDRWRKQLAVGDSLLVCDVGGGTTDFTLIEVDDAAGELALRRAAVGNHILVGGDNMDLALAHLAAERFGEKGVSLDPWQSVALWHSCRMAKEAVLTGESAKPHPITVLGRGSRVVAKSVSISLEREAAAELLLTGFFPACDAADRPARNRASGFRELGLPFETDVAITRHLAGFLGAHGNETSPARPTHVLFNGGVFKAPLLRQRLLDVLGTWFEAGPPSALVGNDDLDHAVARGAAYYALAKQGRGVRIRGGAPRSYYVGIETAGLAIPGARRPMRALCVVPFGMEEGTEADVPSEEIGLVVGEPAQFRFFSSATRKSDRPGDVLARWTEDELAETDPLVATLPPVEPSDEGYVPVRFQSRITELGVFELWCVSTLSNHRWKLEFSVREDEG